MRRQIEITLIAALAVSLGGLAGRADEPRIRLQPKDVVVFLGGTNMLRLQQAGHLETLLTAAFADSKPRFRDLSWEADTVFEQGTVIERWRPDGFGDRRAQLDSIGASVAIVQFGAMESLAGTERLDDFVAAYDSLIDDLQQHARTVILISPTPFESPVDELVPDLSQGNNDLVAYVDAIEKLAQRRELAYVDLFHWDSGSLTSNGLHVRSSEHLRLAKEVARQLRIHVDAFDEYDQLRIAVQDKHRLWYDYWRPANWKLLYGDDSERQFTRGGKDYIPFREEWKRLIPMIAIAEERVWQIAKSEADPGPARPAPESLHGDPTAEVAKELASFTTSDDLQVNLFASEKQGLTSPLAIRWDPSGRTYVTVTTTYPHVYPGDVPNDKVILLEDRDADGVAEHAQVFADGLNIPTGLEWGDGGLYVGQNTELLFLKDTDNDGVADHREVLLSGFGNGDSHQTINSFVWSPGGELYFGQGDGCESRVETPWGISRLFQAGFYRLRPKRLQLHPLLDDFMGPGNPWGVAFDTWGQIFSIDGAGGVTFLSPGQVPTSHRLRLRTIGAPGGYCGISYLDGRHLPPAMRGHFAVGDYKANRVKRFSVERDGAGFKLNWQEPVLTSKHRNFRPVDVKIGPDGAIYVVDWYNPITCHQDDAYRDPTRDKAHGRIWRISSAESSDARPVDLMRANLDTIFAALVAPEPWTRYQAKRALTVHDPSEVASALRAWINQLDPSSSQYEFQLHQALGVFETVEVVDRELLIRLLSAKEPLARAYATRVVGRWHDRLENPLGLLRPLVIDEDPLVRMEAVIACAAIPSSQSVVIAAKAVDEPMDESLRYAFTQTIHHLAPFWLPPFRSGELAFESPQHLARVVNAFGDRSVLDGLRKLARSDNIAPSIRAKAVSAIVAIGQEQDLQDYVLASSYFQNDGRYDADAHARALQDLIAINRFDKTNPGKVDRLLGQRLDDAHPGIRAAALRLIGQWQVNELGDRVVDLAQDDSMSLKIRAASFAALADLNRPDSSAILVRIVDSNRDARLQAAALRSLSQLDTQQAAIHAAELLHQATELTSHDKQALIAAFLDRRSGAESLSDALSKSSIPPTMARELLQSLFATGRSNQTLFTTLNQLAGAENPAPEFDESVIETLVSASKISGNGDRGQVIFENMACLSCHRVGHEGGDVGPNLTSIGSTLAGERIVEELLWPNRQVKEGYSVLQVITHDGRILQGYERRTKESVKHNSLVLRELSTGQLVTIDREHIDETADGGSAMPAGLTAVLSESQLADLIRYLTDLGRNP